MKKSIITLVSLFLVSCSNFAYDGGEFDRIVTIKEISILARNECGTPEIRQKINSIAFLTAHQELFASFRGRREEFKSSSREINQLAQSLKSRYQSSEPSKAYCEEKLTNIDAAATLILSTMGNL